jgi:GNAT superfamily N-acetyltransferase
VAIGSKIDLLIPILEEFQIPLAVVFDPAAAEQLAARWKRGTVLAGMDGLMELVAHPSVDYVLNGLVVDGAARGTGLGAALLERARQHAQEEGACELMLETGNDNPARRLYERSGYQAVTTRTFYTRDVGKA